MKKTFSKKLSLLVASLMVMGLGLTGCGNNNKAEKTGNNTKSVAEANTEKNSEKKVITFWHSEVSGELPKIIQDSADRFMEENPDVEVKIQGFQNDPYKTKIKVAMGANNEPDIFQTWAGGTLYQYIKAGKVADITEFVNKDNYRDHYLDAAMDMVTVDDKCWGIPEYNVSIALVFYNKEIFNKYNIEIPKTYDELLTVSEKLKSEGITPFALANKTKWTGSLIYMYLADRIGGPEVFKNAANRQGGSFEDPVYIKTAEMIQDLVNKGYFNEGFNGLDYDSGQSRTLMYAGKAAMEVMGSWNLKTVKGENEDFYNNNLGYFPFPAIEGGKGDPNNVVGSIGDMFCHISNKCKYKEEAFRFLQFLMDDVAVQKRAEAGLVPPVKGFKSEDAMLQGVLDITQNAKSVQQWYDQYLTPELAEVHKDTSQAVFGLTMTPEEAAKAMEDAVKEYYEEN